MHLTRLSSAVLVGTALLAPSLAESQGFSRLARPRPTGPRIMIATPFAFAAADSAPAVEIAVGMRDRMERIVGREYQVIPDSVMNSALLQYGYSKDAILSPALALTLAKNIQARVIVASTLTKRDGRYQLQARLSGTNDDAGYAVVVNQAQGQRLRDFGDATATVLSSAVKHLDDAKDCVDQQKTKQDKARESALKVLKDVPTHGLANYCLAELTIAAKGPRDEAIKYLENATKGDSLSLRALTLLVGLYQQKDDTAKVITTYGQLLRVAPTNQRLREEIFRSFLSYGKPDAARLIADEGLAIDPFNRDLYDLKSNACLFQSDFKCAVSSLEQAYAIDSTAADTLFFAKISVAAQQGEDTEALLKWASIGNKRYPDNTTIVEYLQSAYALKATTEPAYVDSTANLSRRLMEAQPENAAAIALKTAQLLASVKRFSEMEPFVAVVEAKGDAAAKEQVAAFYYNAAAVAVQAGSTDPSNFEKALVPARRAVALAPVGSSIATQSNYLLGIAAFYTLAGNDPKVEAAKACDGAKAQEALLAESDAALTRGKAQNPTAVGKLQENVGVFRPRIASMIKAYCK
jgi:hypothetical protein